jgi:AFG3 family protein
LCNEAAILAARNNKTHVDAHDLEMATERIIGGIERKSIISLEEKRTVAVHESGHAVVSWFLEGADPLLKLTIIPRSKGSLGFAQYFVNETKLNTKTQLIDRICFILGGRCAEEQFFGKITNGASDDLKKAYEIAHSIVVKLGMSEEIGYVGFRDSEYLRPYS